MEIPDYSKWFDMLIETGCDYIVKTDGSFIVDHIKQKDDNVNETGFFEGGCIFDENGIDISSLKRIIEDNIEIKAQKDKIGFFPVCSSIFEVSLFFSYKENILDELILIFKNITVKNNAETTLEYQSSVVINASDNFICMLDNSLKIIYMNPAAYGFLGIEKEPLDSVNRHINFKDIFTPEYYKKLFFESLSSIKEKKKWKSRGQMIDVHGKIIDIEQMIFPVFKNDGQYIGIGTIISDITDTIIKENSLKEIQKTLELIIDNVPYSIFWKNTESKYIGCNTKFKDMLGKGLDFDIYSKTDYDIHPRQTAELFIKEDEYLIQNSRKHHYEEKIKYDGYGNAIWNAVTKVLIQNENNETFAILGIIEDITERKENERRITAAHANLEAVIVNYPGGIWCVDSNKTVTVAEGAELEKIGFAREDNVIGKSIYTVFEKYPEMLSNFESTFENGPQSWTYKVNESSFVCSTSYIIDKFGSQVGIIGTAVDMTEMANIQEQLKTAIEKAENANHAKSNFLSRMSHEIRTPMNAIIGMTKIALTTKNEQKITSSLEKIDSASKQLLNIINDILDMSKIEAQKFELVSEPFNFETIVEKVYNMMIVKTDEKKQKLYINIDRKIEDFYISDEMRLTQILVNLLGNAVKFTPEQGYIKLSAAQVSQTETDSILEFRITDNGIGISKEQQKKLFTSFEQADGTISRKYGGTGLGLAICKNIVELMGGKIWIESEEGKGSTFAFTVKCKRTNEKSAKRKIRMQVKNADVRVLVVDDSEETRNYFEHILSNFGIECDLADNGATGLELAKKAFDEKRPYHVIFMDYMMDKMNGIETAEKISSLKDSPTIIIMISSSSWSEIENEAKAAGIEKFISKPLFQSTIFNAINTLSNVNQTQDNKRINYKNDFSNYTILLAEDVEINREIIITLLEDTKINIECAVNGEEAYKMFRDNPGRYSLILMDVQMPIYSGYEATKLIRMEKDKRAKTIPIIAMTANAFKEDIELSLSSGMNDHISKPVDMDILLNKISDYLLKSNASEEYKEERETSIAVFNFEGMMPDINFEEGLQKFNGNKKLYCALLKAFKGREVYNNLMNYITGEDYNKIIHYAQSLRTLATNLCLPPLLSVSIIIESRAKAKYRVDEDVVGELTKSINSVYEKIELIIKNVTL